MATIRAYTTIEQSKKLAEILPLESADMFWEYHDKWCSEGEEWEGYEDYPRAEPYLEYFREENEWKEDKSDVPAWSLAALISVLPNNEHIETTISRGGWKIEPIEYLSNTWWCEYEDSESLTEFNTSADNPVDACYEMVLKLNELNLL